MRKSHRAVCSCGAQATLRNENPLLSQAWKQALGITAPGSQTTVTLGKRNVEGGAARC